MLEHHCSCSPCNWVLPHAEGNCSGVQSAVSHGTAACDARQQRLVGQLKISVASVSQQPAICTI